MSEWTDYDELAKMGDELKALLADREALVRLFRASVDEHWWENRKNMSAWQALSQELRDEINAI